MGQIDVRSRDVANTFGFYDHAYVVYSYTDENGVKKERAIGGYPASGVLNAPNYKVVEGEFKAGHPDYPKKEDKGHITIGKVYDGPDAGKVWEKIEREFKALGAANPYDAFKQNSNSIVNSTLKNLGLPSFSQKEIDNKFGTNLQAFDKHITHPGNPPKGREKEDDQRTKELDHSLNDSDSSNAFGNPEIIAADAAKVALKAGAQAVATAAAIDNQMKHGGSNQSRDPGSNVPQPLGGNSSGSSNGSRGGGANGDHPGPGDGSGSGNPSQGGGSSSGSGSGGNQGQGGGSSNGGGGYGGRDEGDKPGPGGTLGGGGGYDYGGREGDRPGPGGTLGGGQPSQDGPSWDGPGWNGGPDDDGYNEAGWGGDPYTDTGPIAPRSSWISMATASRSFR
jgi:hypothetical protein